MPSLVRPWRATALAVTLPLLASPSLAKDYYVDPVNGRDVATGGTKTAPWKTIQYAVSQAYTAANAGDHTFHLAAGGYRETVHFNYAAAKDYVATFAGASQFTVAIIGGFRMGNRMKGLSVSKITCDTIDYDTWDPSSSRSGSLSVSECQVLQLVKHHSKGSGPPAPTNIRDSIVRKIELSFCCDAGVSGGIVNCRVGSGGITHLGACQPFAVRRCYVDGPVRFRLNEASTLDILESTFPTGGLHLIGELPSTVTVDDCVVSKVAGTGIDIEANMSAGERLTVKVRNSSIYDCGQGIRMRGIFGRLELFRTWVADNRGAGIEVTGLFGTELECDGAMIERNTGPGIRITETATGTTSHSLDIANSVLARNERGVSVVGRSSSAASFSVDGCTIADNSLSGIDKTNVTDANATVTHTILAGKLPLGGSPWNVTRCLSDTKLLPGTKNVAADPRFVSRSQGDYRLQPLSPAVDAGEQGAGGMDVDGDPRHIAIRTAFAHRDIGADELSYTGHARRFGAGASTWGMARFVVSQTGVWRLGARTTMEVRGPKSSDLLFWLADMQAGPVFELVPGIPIYLATPSWVVLSDRKPTGEGTLSTFVPNAPILVGAGLVMQALGGGASGTAVSPMVRVAIGR